MAIRQTSLFDFDNEPEPSPKPEEIKPAAKSTPSPESKESTINIPKPQDEIELSGNPSLDEKLLEQNYISESFVLEELEEPVNDLSASDSFVSSSSKKSFSENVVAPKKSTRGRMKLSEMSNGADLIDIPEDAVLFEKRYYSIGTVSEMFKVNISLIRFWENEFDILKPRKNGKGDRHFRPEDIKNLQLIYHLLREKKYTIEGAKDFLKKNKRTEETFAAIEGLKKLKDFLNEIKTNLL